MILITVMVVNLALVQIKLKAGEHSEKRTTRAPIDAPILGIK